MPEFHRLPIMSRFILLICLRALPTPLILYFLQPVLSILPVIKRNSGAAPPEIFGGSMNPTVLSLFLRFNLYNVRPFASISLAVDPGIWTQFVEVHFSLL